MVRILLVENDSEWRDSVTRALPGYQVDAAPSYDDALRLMAEGGRYEVAIVNLNLIDSAERNAGDLLGGEVLLQLRRDHPMTRRIALTAWPPGAVRGQVFDRYGVDELLIKSHLTLSSLREVVQLSLERTSAHLPADARAKRSAIGDDFRSWRDGQVRRLDQQRRMLLNDLHMSGPMSTENTQASGMLQDLERWRADFESACREVETMLATIDSPDDIDAVTQIIENLRREFERPSQS